MPGPTLPGEPWQREYTLVMIIFQYDIKRSVGVLQCRTGMARHAVLKIVSGVARLSRMDVPAVQFYHFVICATESELRRRGKA